MTRVIGRTQVAEEGWGRYTLATITVNSTDPTGLQEQGMSTVTVERVEARLSAVRCAICKTNQFAIDRRTMQPDGEWKGVCLKCRYTFPIHADMEFYQRTQPDIPYILKAISCPSCRNRGVQLDFRIVMSVREAFYFVTCQSCHHEFPEKSSLETFE